MTRRHLVIPVFILLLAAAGYFIFSSGVPHTSAQFSESQLSETGKQQILALLAEKESRTPAQQKIDSQVLQAVRENRGEKMAPGVDSLEPANVGQSEGSVTLDLTADVDNNLLSALKQQGAEIISSFPVYHSVRIHVPLTQVENIAALSQIKFIQHEQKPDLDKAEPNAGAQSIAKTLPVAGSSIFEQRAENVRQMLGKYTAESNNTGETDAQQGGTVISQGDRAHRVDNARATYGHQGEGIKIGIISDSFGNLGAAAVNADIASGNLPGPGNPNGNTTPVTVVLDATSGGTDEGRAMTQIVHDLVPKAQLYFATANGGQAGFATNIIALRNAGCNIIIDDISYSTESPFQSGPVGIAVETVVNGGGFYFASAGNAGSVLKGTSGVWEGDFNDGGALAITGNTKTGTVHNFGTAAAPILRDIVTVASSRNYLLFWSDPLGTSTNDYDLFILRLAMDGVTETVVASSTTTQNGTQDPFESPSRVATIGDRIVIFKAAAAAQRAIHVNANRGAIQTFTNGQIRTHSGTVQAAYSVAAAPAAGPFPNAFSSTSQVETFTSDGPRRVFYTSAGLPITPGNVLFSTSGGQLLAKPDITAADGVATTLPTTSGLNPFFGTSAAAPHAGAIAGLILSGNNSLTLPQMRTILENNAVDVETPGNDITTGKGIIQAFQSVGASSPTLSAGLDLGTVTATEGYPSNNNGVIDPGEGVNVVVQLTNPSAATATSVQATLGPASPTSGATTNFAGGEGKSGNVQNAASPVVSAASPRTYGDIASGGNAVNGTPFYLTLSQQVACGADIPVVLVADYGNGSGPSAFNFTIKTGTAPVSTGTALNLNTTIDATAPASGAGYTAATGTQINRLNRNAVTSSCASPKATPALQEAAPGSSRRYDSYTLTNTNAGAVCYTVSFNTACNTGTTLYSAAYGNGGYNPAAIQSNYIADSGFANALPAYSFSVPAGQQFTVVVHEIPVITSPTNCNYTVNISGITVPVCQNFAPTAAPVSVSGRVLAGRQGLANARVEIKGMDGKSRTVMTNPFGNFLFNEVESGTTYVISVSAKGYKFPPQAVSVTDNLSGLVFSSSSGGIGK